jgi:hypothetical protein
MLVKSKPVLGVDDLLLLLTCHWARDKFTFPTERQRVQFALILLLAAYTGCRPAELVDASKSVNTSKPTKVKDQWDNLDSVEYDDVDDDKDAMSGVESASARCKALCYEDVRLLIVQNLVRGEQDVLAIEVTMAHHKGVDKRLKP